jgi:hypothetical protein
MQYLLFCFAFLALSISLSARGAPLPDTVQLPPEHVEAIQALGQAVLQAKKSQTPDPEIQELKQSAEALKAAIDGVDSITLPSSPAQSTINTQPSAKSLKAQNTGPQDVTATAAFRKQLDHYHAQHAELESNMLARAKTKAKLEKQASYPILLRLRQMNDELDQALTAPVEERHQRLAQLKQRLEPPTKGNQHLSGSDQNKGLTTITRHYRNEQAASAPTVPHP